MFNKLELSVKNVKKILDQRDTFDLEIIIMCYLVIVRHCLQLAITFYYSAAVQMSPQPEYIVHLASYSMYFGDKVIERNQIMLDQHKGLYCWVKSRAGAQ